MAIANITGNILTDSGVATSSLLPLTGGTLTGALSITSAATYALDVTGTGRFSGALRTESTINMTGTGAQLLQTTANSVAGDNVMVLYNSNANSYGLYIGAGSGTNHALYITDSTRNANLFKVQGNGNVGIGTASPGTLLQVSGSSTTYGTAFSIYNTSNSKQWNFTAVGSGAGSRNGNLEINNNASDILFIKQSGEIVVKQRNLSVTSENSNDIGVWIKGIGTHSSGYASIQSFASDVTYDTNLVLQENGGRVGIGITNPSIKLHVVAGSGTGTTTAFCLERGGGYGATFFKQYYNNGSDWGLIVQSSTNADGVKLVQGATSWTSNSDERLKDIIEPISNATDKINTLRAVVGKYKTDDEDKRRLFLIAQDVNNVFPEVVDIDGTDDAYMGIRYSELVPVLVKAIQELNAKVSALENKS
jgi:hypothetical protein